MTSEEPNTSAPAQAETEPAETPLVPEAETERFESPPILLPAGDQPVDPRTITLHRWVGLLSLLIPSAILFLVLTLTWLFGGLPGSVYGSLVAGLGLPIVGLGLWLWHWPVLHYRHLRYRVDRLGLRIHRGVVWRRSISVPTTRVQHTDVTQGPWQRRYSLATLTVHTAGTQGASISLAGLEHETALRLRDHLMTSRDHGE